MILPGLNEYLKSKEMCKNCTLERNKEMNDVEILKDFAEGKIQQDKLEHYRGSYKMGYFYTKDLQQALKNILKERQEDKERIKELERQCDIYEKDVIHYKKLFSISRAEDIEDMIPKSLVREKIEEYESRKEKCNDLEMKVRLDVKIRVYEELLGEEK